MALGPRTGLADWYISERYDLGCLIGTGSYGSVCQAYDRLEGRNVAIKRIPRVFEDLVDCKRILREIAILNRLVHHGTVRLFDIYIPSDPLTFDEIYIVLEIADSDLKKLFRRPVSLFEMHVKALLYNLLSSLKYIHSAGVYHRDLKPANCLVNQDCTIKICDFGLARTVNRERSNSSIQNLEERLTTHVVTRWYRPPELILLQENYTQAIDVWSAGCIFAELMNMIKGNCQHPSLRRALFPGEYAFPVSLDSVRPADYRHLADRGRDQLNMIFNVIGTPSEADILELESEDARRYVRSFAKHEREDLAIRFPASSREARDLLSRMLVFNPRKRMTVEQCLSHPYLADMHASNTQLNAPVEQRVVLPFNDWRAMEQNHLRYALLREAQMFHPEIKIPEELQRFGYENVPVSNCLA